MIFICLMNKGKILGAYKTLFALEESLKITYANPVVSFKKDTDLQQITVYEDGELKEMYTYQAIETTPSIRINHYIRRLLLGK